MSLTTTTLNGTITASVNRITLAAFTNPSTGGVGPVTLLQFATGETMLVTDATYSPTLAVVRGYAGTPAAAHTSLEGVQYGLSSDSAWPAAPARFVSQPVLAAGYQEVVATGATGSTAATVTPAQFAFLNCNATGASGAGINLPYPTTGAAYTIKNGMTGALKIYAVGATINGTTGTTAVTLTATGNLMAWAFCTTAGAWQVSGNT